MRVRGVLGGSVVLLAMATLGCDGSTRDGPTGRAFLERAWDVYKRTYVRGDGYVLDPSREQGETTSEGQGYALLRAAWMRDEAAFSRLFRWTEQRLKRPDGLYSWRWTPADGGRVLDRNTAADANQEIAFALILASSAFDEPALLERARELLWAIRTYEAIPVSAGWFPSAGDWAVADRIVNLSYFLPYAYPYFARLDPEGGWGQVIGTGYDLMARALQLPNVRLVPDFMIVTRDGAVSALPEQAPLSRDFSSDAMRIFWRVALDCRLHAQRRACTDPLAASQLARLLSRDGSLFTRYRVDGSPLERTESISFYSIALPFLLIYDPEAARAIQTRHLTPSALQQVMDGKDRYYDSNWVWFGLAAAGNLIAERTPPVAAFPPRSLR